MTAAILPKPYNLLMRVVTYFSRAFSREAAFRHFGIAIALMSFLLGVVTYVLLADDVVVSENINKFYWILGLDIVLLMAMTAVVGLRVRDVWKKHKQHMAGAQLHVQLMTIFSVLVTVPAVLVTVFAVVFIHYGVQSWFGENIKTAVEESHKIAQSYLKEHQQSIRADMLAMAGDMNRLAPRLLSDKEVLNEFFQTQVYLRNLSEAILVDSSGRVLQRAGLTFSIEFLPSDFTSLIEQANSGQVVMVMSENDDRVRSLVKLDNFIDTYLFVGRFVDENVLARINATNEAVDIYETLETRQTNLKINMSLIFVLVTLMLLLVAIWAGLSLAERIIMPVTRLIQAAERVRSGDLNARVEVGTQSENEVTVLARAFNRMTDQLGAQRRDLLNANIQLDERRRFTETVLGGVNAGIIGMDGQGIIQITNASALRLLKRQDHEVIGKKLADICPEMEKIRRMLRSKAGRGKENSMNVETPLDVSIDGQENQSHWIVRMTADGEKPDDNGDVQDMRSYVVTFDDLSPLIAAQRQAAWSDVARRVAHEIKNPLTPIQLSAERLKRRYSKQVSEDLETFQICTDTIIRSVDDIRHMVDEFSNFARMPQSSKKPENIVTLCQQVMVLFQQGHRDAAFVFERPERPMQAIVDRQQMTQAMTNLVKNAYEAITQDHERQDDVKPVVTLDLQEDDQHIIVTIADNGPGWPQELLPRLADPYVTTKADGTGLGLAIVSKIIEDHAGRMAFLNNTPQGAIVRVFIPKGDIRNG